MDWKEAAKNILGRFKTVDDCLVWTGSTVAGYGSVSVHNKSYRVHRIVWQLINGEIPSAAKNADILHTCDNKLCSNPDHLYLGEAGKNLDDFYKRHIMPDGRRSFNEEEKSTIQRMYNDKRFSLREISRAVSSDHHKVKRYINKLRNVKI